MTRDQIQSYLDGLKERDRKRGPMTPPTPEQRFIREALEFLLERVKP